jgi:hypothetical protein
MTCDMTARSVAFAATLCMRNAAAKSRRHSRKVALRMLSVTPTSFTYVPFGCGTG